MNATGTQILSCGPTCQGSERNFNINSKQQASKAGECMSEARTTPMHQHGGSQIRAAPTECPRSLVLHCTSKQGITALHNLASPSMLHTQRACKCAKLSVHRGALVLKYFKRSSGYTDGHLNSLCLRAHHQQGRRTTDMVGRVVPALLGTPVTGSTCCQRRHKGTAWSLEKPYSILQGDMLDSVQAVRGRFATRLNPLASSLSSPLNASSWGAQLGMYSQPSPGRPIFHVSVP